MAIINVATASLPTSDAMARGQYRLRIDGVTDPDKDKNGALFVGLDLTVIKGDNVNRKVFDNYVRLDSAKFRKVCAAAGHDGEVVKDTNDMVGWEVEAMVGVEDSERFGERNIVSLYITPMGFGK